jgi:flagellar basal body-associated protein FliL
MDTMWVVIIIVLVLGVVIGNITLLKYSAKFKFPVPDKKAKSEEEKNETPPKKNNWDDEDDY